jgi:hypothetical protein
MPKRSDSRAAVGELEVRPPLTFYDPADRHGYKLIVATDDGWVDQEVLDDAAAWASARRLPDGTPLSGVTLVTPDREGALAIRDRALARGIGRVLYATNDGSWWDPAPKQGD